MRRCSSGKKERGEIKTGMSGRRQLILLRAKRSVRTTGTEENAAEEEIRSVCYQTFKECGFAGTDDGQNKKSLPFRGILYKLRRKERK